jgi:glycosyltransferase 2 family protein
MTDLPIHTRIAGPLIRGAVSIALILLIVLNLDTSEFGAALAAVSIATLVALTAIDLLLRILSAYRWHVLFNSTNASASLLETIKITFVASFLGQALPGVIGVEALRVYGLARSSDDAAGAFASVVADRVFGLLSLVLVIFAGLIIGPHALESFVLVPVLIAFAILVVAVLLLMIPGTRKLYERSLPSAWLDKVKHWVDQVYDCFDRYKERPGLLAYSLVLALSFQVLRVFLFFAAALMIGESPSFIYFVVFVPIVMFASLLPVSIGGLGVREAGLVVLFSRFDVMDSAPTFTIAILVFVSGLLSTLPGGWIYARQRKQLHAVMEKAKS